jgi:hypothetical protein
MQRIGVVMGREGCLGVNKLLRLKFQLRCATCVWADG